MALPHLIKYIYSNGSEEAIRRGKKIYNTGNVELINHDELTETASLRVKDDSYNTWYKVRAEKFRDETHLSVECTCPFNQEDMCRHQIAGLFYLQDLIDSNMLGEQDLIQYDQKYTVIRMKNIDIKMLRLLSDMNSYDNAEDFVASHKIKLEEARDEKVKAVINYQNEKHNVLLQKNEERNFDTSCDCHSDPLHPLCVHKLILFIHLLKDKGPNYFDTIRNLDKEKNKLLALYGFSLEDNIKGKFEFALKDGKPFLRVLDPTIKRVAVVPTESKPKPSYYNREAEKEEKKSDKPETKYGVGLVLSHGTEQYPYLNVDAIEGEVDEDETEFLGKVLKLDLSKYVETDMFSDNDKQLIQQIRKILPAEVNKYLNRNSPFSGIWDNIVQHSTSEALPEETRKLILEYIHPKLKKIFNTSSSSYFTFYLEDGQEFKTDNLEVANYSINFITPEFKVSKDGDKYEIVCLAKTPLGTINVGENEIESSILLQVENQFYLWQKPEDIILVEKFLPTGKIIFPISEWHTALQDFILPLSHEYSVKFENIEKDTVDSIKPTVKILLKEKGAHLIIDPIFLYKDYEVHPDDKDKILIPDGTRLLEINRDKEAEAELLAKIENLHSGFIHPDKNSATLAINGNEALKNNWFFLFLDATREINVPVFGLEALKKFRFNTAKPSTKIFISSHTDWFDAKVDIRFGDQTVSVSEIKKALASKQQFVQLADGTLGVLPEEWVQKYSLLFQVGQDETNKDIKLSKYHFSIIEELYEKRDEEELVFQLEEKYENLKNNHNIQDVPPPDRLQATLRPYQISGFQWLNYLSEVNWGGILADDMGLGKTIQTLSFLYHLQGLKDDFKCLVVCPTTLMYNWSNEIQKFTPEMTHYIYHGGNRIKGELKKNDANLIITTYGTLRSDIKIFSEINFDYVVLDESQAIKNPSSKIAKAVALLKAANRLCLSGTPLQNNTFDIYAQMNFLNPGLLGSIDFFKQQFAVPIDKFGEKEQKEHLRKLLYPFILRRTKEQVAKDLPEKTETIIFCEMEKEQREIYDAYRNDYRDKIMGVIEAQGIQKSQLTILQGLMRLRQICDSPAILKDEDYPNKSVKLEEIERQIEENVGTHKTLIFSQFLGMLGLIRNKLDHAGIKYEYFDGSTTAPDREKAIQNFQNNEECRVFLISLKAGGVGLNLTAADYVYLVDPWWNPAVEQQAIDRTHRIGQTKNIFAYRMICRNTVEDKILQLQERKKALAAELISDDTGFIKTLTKADIEYLFS
ncbi:DEAD/DEAH box helicase [Rhizosphaericola mali]|uniref:Helicase SNF2 n=1 Tax=Rhizosphaericola mali TaxID=2545455 RepID=A0A5P2G584_9BACT|nr:DEAD/DEAH box helicase [Rhizosphaericola mali]QES90994.1 helicase SNF2 [Rhizosphaericola mali]